MPTMIDPSSTSLAHRRRAAVLGGAGAGIALLAGLAVLRFAAGVARTVSARATVHLDDAVLVLALGLLGLAVLWLSIVTAASSWQVLRPTRTAYGTRALDRLSPVFVGRITAVLLVLTAASGVTGAGGAHASSSISAPDLDRAPRPGLGGLPDADLRRLPVPGFERSAPSIERLDLDTAPAPSFGTSACASDHLPEPAWSTHGPRQRAVTDRAGLLGGCRSAGDAPAETAPRQVVVRRGDTLWSIVQRHLGPNADHAAVAAEWPRWHELNRAAIGPDPGVLLPGTTLNAPQPVSNSEALR